MQPRRSRGPAAWLLLLVLVLPPAAQGQRVAAGTRRSNSPARELHRLPSAAAPDRGPRLLPPLTDSGLRRTPALEAAGNSEVFPAPDAGRDRRGPPVACRLPCVGAPADGTRLPRVALPPDHTHVVSLRLPPDWTRLPPVGSGELPDMEAYFVDQVCRVPGPAPPWEAEVRYSQFRAESDGVSASDGPRSGPDNRREPIGERPGQTINEQFLSQSSLLLQPGVLQYDLGFIYNWLDLQSPVVLPPGIVAERRLRRRDFILPLNVRYGLRKDVELFAQLPLGLTNLELSDPSRGTSTTKGGIGDLTAGLLYDLQTGKVGWPEMTASVRVTAPTGDGTFGLLNYDAALGNGFWSIATVLNIVKSYDPLVVFGSVGYRHDFEEDFLGIDVQPGEHFTYSYGLAFAVNDDCSLVTEMFGEFQGPTQVNGVQLPSTSFEPIGLRLSMVRRITPTARIQPFVAFALNEDAQDVSCGFLFTRDVKIPPVDSPCPPSSRKEPMQHGPSR